MEARLVDNLYLYIPINDDCVFLSRSISSLKIDQFQIRLMHVNTRRNLHSHVYSSHLSNGQEVSAYGDNGVGDQGDDWTVSCSTGNWKRDAEVRFKHAQVSFSCAKCHDASNIFGTSRDPVVTTDLVLMTASLTC